MQETPGSECLPYGDKELGGTQPGHGLQQVTDVKPHRTNGGVIAEAEAHGVSVIVDQVRHSDVPVNVAAVVKENATQVVHHWNGKAQLAIDDEELQPADRHG